MKLKFGLLPGHWGLKGKTREIAKAEYELSGFELDQRLLEINQDLMDEMQYKQKSAELEFKYRKINEETYHRRLAELITDETQRALAIAEIDYRSGKLGETEYQKTVATIRREPWVTVIKMDFNTGSSLEGSFELDWNEFFVEKLEKEGYSGPSSEHLVNAWFMELCKNIAMEEFDGTGEFSADAEANIEAMKRWNNEQIDGSRRSYG